MSPLACRAPLQLRIMVLCAALGGMGCGASIQAIYAGDVRFEHCMALDAQVGVAAPERRDCWQDWVSRYTYGQTWDRVQHAQQRVRALSNEPPQ